MKNLDHWRQNWLTQRFQPYVETWAYPDDHTATEYDLSVIAEMPISLYVAGNSEVCTTERADELADQLSTLQNHYVFAGIDNDYFNWGLMGSYTELIYNEVGAELLDTPNKLEVEVYDGAQSGLAVITVVTAVLFAAIQSIF